MRNNSGFKKDVLFIILPPTLIVILSILSFLYVSIAFFPPRYPHHKLLAKRKEAVSNISTSLKAAEAYYREYGKLANSTRDLGEYVSSIWGCKTNDPRICLKSANEYYSALELTKWYSPEGNHEIEMKSVNDQNIFVATPIGKIKKKGYGVSGCFNSKNGKTKILEMYTKGPNVEIANCDD